MRIEELRGRLRLVAVGGLLVLLVLGLAPWRQAPEVHGQTTTAVCNDSDGGLNYNVAGYVSGIGSSGWSYVKHDLCETGDQEGTVREYYCNGTTAWPKFYSCPYGCENGACISTSCTDADGDGYAIEGGACGEVDCNDCNPNVHPGATEVCNNGVDDDCNGFTDLDDPACAPSCSDSDGGLNYNVAGYVSGIGSSGWSYTKHDLCETGDKAGFVREYYCNGTTAWPKFYRCPYGCQDGACVPSGTCTDADGDGYAIEGGACGAVDCDDHNPNIHPGAAEICTNGIDDDCNGLVDLDDPACAGCRDTDTGIKPYRRGTVTLTDGTTYVDTCISANDLRETSCDGAGHLHSDVISCPNGCQDGACVAPNVLMIGWDGVQRDHLIECYERQLPECAAGLPGLRRLGGGTIWNAVLTSGDTCTKPGWAQIASGYNAEVMGIYNLTDYQPLPAGYSVFEKAEAHFGADHIVSIFVSGKGVHTGGACVGDPTYHNGVPVIEDKGQPYCYTKESLDIFELDRVANDAIGNRTLELLETYQHDLFLAYIIFRDPDVTGHLYNEDAVEYSNQIMAVDTWLGRILDKLEALGLADNTVVIVTTDHGFDEGGSAHLNAPYTFMVTNDPGVLRSGDRKDIAPTILDRLDISLGALGGAPAVDGESLLAPRPFDCVPEGRAFIDYPGAPTCCAGLTLVGLDKKYGGCKLATGGEGDTSGYCTRCGDGVCTAPESPCNCPQDCPLY